MDCPGIERGSFVMEKSLRTCGQLRRNRGRMLRNALI